MDNKCNYQDNTKNEAVSKLADILNKSGAKACTTTAELATSYANMDASLRMGPPFLGPEGKLSVNVGTQESKGSNSGCESIIATNEEYRKTINNVKCTFESIKSESKNNLSAINEINIMGLYECDGNASFNQTINTKSLSASSLSEVQQEAITNNIVDGLKLTADTMEKDKSGFGTTPQGSKILSNIQTELNSTDINNKMKENMQSSLNSLFANNKLNINNFHGKGDCKIDQTIIAEMVASTVVDNAFNNIFQSFIIGSTEHTAKITAEHINEAPPPPPPLPSVNVDSYLTYIYIVLVIAGLAGFAGLIYIIYKLYSKNHSESGEGANIEGEGANIEGEGEGEGEGE